MTPPTNESLVTTFLSKLKEQSFTIILMIGILYYQNTMWNRDHKELEDRISDLDKQVKECNARERALYVDKGEALKKQREEFLTILRQINTYGNYYVPPMMAVAPQDKP